MSKGLKWGLIGVGVLAVLALLAIPVSLAFVWWAESDSAEINEALVAEQAAPAEPVVVRAPRPTPREQAESLDAEPKSVESDGEAEPGGEEVLGSEDATVRQRMAGLLDSFTDEERRELTQQLRRERIAEWRERRRYSLPSSGRLRFLQFRRDDTTKVTEGQEAQIAEIDEIMKPKIETALQAIWAQQKQLREQAEALRLEGREDEARQLWEQARDLRRQEREIKEQLDEEYKVLLRGVLTEEQMQYLEQPGRSFHVDARRGRRDNDSESSDRNTAGGESTER